MLGLVGHQLDQVVGAGSHALAAGNTFFLIHHGHAVHHVDGVKGAGLYAGAVAHTSVSAGLLSGSRYHGNLLAVVHAVVVVLHLGLVAGAGALDEGHLLVGGSAGNAHDGADLLRRGSAAHRTCAHVGLARRDGLGQGVTARVSAAAAVVAGQLVADQNLSLIHFHFKLLAGNA